MHTVAILGAGDLGGALARTLASGDAVSRIVLIDDARTVAAGKALDIRQTGPIESYDTAIDGTDDLHQASGADVVVLADRHGQPELSGEAGLALVDRVARMTPAPLVFAGASHHVLMTLAIKELKLPTPRLIGSAPVAAAAAARALMAPALDASPVDVTIPILGLPPSWVLAWDRACSAGAPIDMPPHAAARVEQVLAASWPPGAYSPGLGRVGSDSRDPHELATTLLLLPGDAVWQHPPGGVCGAGDAWAVGHRDGRRTRTDAAPARRARVHRARPELTVTAGGHGVGAAGSISRRRGAL